MNQPLRFSYCVNFKRYSLHNLKQEKLVMKFLMKFSIPMKPGNAALSDSQFGGKLKQLLSDMKAEAAYFTPVKGQRGGYIVLNMDDASQIAAFSEPMFFWFDAEVEFLPVMLMEILKKQGRQSGQRLKSGKSNCLCRVFSLIAVIIPG